MDKLIGLIRVSTDKQGKSGLGLQAQEAAIEDYRARIGGTLLRTYTEIESGGHDDITERPQLLKAVAHAKRSKATLVIARLDRLVRSTVVMAHLKQSGVRFVACDMPTANEFTVDIHVAVAADERRKISIRTRDALRAYRSLKRTPNKLRELYPNGLPDDVAEFYAERAGKLGASLPECRNLTDADRRKGAKLAGLAHAKRADDAYADIAEYMLQLRAEGLTQQAIADRLNDDGHTTRTGKPWNQVQVGRVLKRATA